MYLHNDPVWRAFTSNGKDYFTGTDLVGGTSFAEPTEAEVTDPRIGLVAERGAR